VNNLSIGAVYTPYKWAKFAIERYDLFDDWIAGKTIFDPTMGEGHLLAALVQYGFERGYAPGNLPIQRLFGAELNTAAYTRALEKFAHAYDADMRTNFINSDIMALGESFDVVFGNPPWCNFVDLPAEYREPAKKWFIEYDLVDNPQALLLGGSRMDIAALVIQKCIYRNLVPGGKAVFFLPLSLFLNDAHARFRQFKIYDSVYSLRSVYDFENLEVFAHISTRYGLACFQKQSTQSESIPWYLFGKDTWTEHRGAAREIGGSLLISSDTDGSINIPKIQVSPDAKPRQGINPCGAIGVFVFDKYEEMDTLRCRVNDIYLLPKKYVYPLITKNNFKQSALPAKWVLLPYNDKTGKPLTPSELDNAPLLRDYLRQFRDILINRKGTLIQAYIQRGIWWALLGVGKYNFQKYKIVWEAYGKASFRPQLFAGVWQANQSLQAFIPCAEESKAESLLAQLSDPAIEQYLLSSKMAGTMSWAQPGRISSILDFTESEKSH
jgi:hypothetical protein